LQPLAFLDYLLEDLSQAVVFSTEHIVLVNVPNPIRFAVHKLIVSAERQGTYRLKAAKDIAQAAHLFATLMKQQTDGIGAALEKAHRRGPGWAQRLSQGSAKLQAAFPEWCEAVGWSKLLPT
jgi:hypothetical protein